MSVVAPPSRALRYGSVLFVAAASSPHASFPAAAAAALIQLTTMSGVIPGRSAREVHDFLLTPTNWPKIVLSSWSVEDVVVETAGKNKSTTTGRTDRAFYRRKNDEKGRRMRLDVGSSVDEIFGLPPLLPLRVRWTCISTDSSSGILDVRSPDGVPGLASDCRMLFEVRDVSGGGGASNDYSPSSTCTKLVGSEVSLRMEYEPRSPLARLALPILAVDNALALRVLLPSAMDAVAASAITPLDRFRRLMGALYGVAGLAHLADCVVGPSRLLIAAGCLDGFYGLPPAGRALALAWCLAGPAAFVATRVGGPRVADLGIAGYGVVEVGCAWLASSSATAAGVVPELDVVTNALAVQAIVATSWLYSSSRGEPSSE